MADMRDVNATAKHFNISAYYARQLALSGKVSAVRVGRSKILINQESVEAYFNTATLTEPAQINYNKGVRQINPVVSEVH